MWFSSGNIHREEEGPFLHFRHTFGAAQRGPPTMIIPRVWRQRQTDSGPRHERERCSVWVMLRVLFPGERAPGIHYLEDWALLGSRHYVVAKRKSVHMFPKVIETWWPLTSLTELSWPKDYIKAFIYLSNVLYTSNISTFIRWFLYIYESLQLVRFVSFKDNFSFDNVFYIILFVLS